MALSSKWCLIFVASNLILGTLIVSMVEAKPDHGFGAIEDNEFAEFEEIDDDSEEFVSNIKVPDLQPEERKQVPLESAKQTVEQPQKQVIVDDVGDDDEEFESVQDEEDEPKIVSNVKEREDLKITKIPMHLQNRWQSYSLELTVILGLVLYFINYIIGRNKNYTFANTWYEQNVDLLQYNFALVGDDGKKEIENLGLNKECENVYTLWCSGRSAVDGLLVELQLLKRQDIFSIIVNFFKPSTDKIHIRASLSEDTMDSFVFCIANRKKALALSKDLNDVSTFCPERKSPEKYGITSDSYLLMNEIGEAASFILDNKVVSLLNKNEDLIDFLHISDQYSGYKNPDDVQVKLPEGRKVLHFSINVPSKLVASSEQLERIKPLVQMTFYLVDRLKRFRLSRESKLKSEKNRIKVEKQFLQSTHLQRQEMAQIKREERRRQEKEKILAESDPEKQRRWEEKEYKREMKRKTPKMKQLKVKGM